MKKQNKFTASNNKEASKSFNSKNKYKKSSFRIKKEEIPSEEENESNNTNSSVYDGSPKPEYIQYTEKPNDISQEMSKLEYMNSFNDKTKTFKSFHTLQSSNKFQISVDNNNNISDINSNIANASTTNNGSFVGKKRKNILAELSNNIITINNNYNNTFTTSNLTPNNTNANTNVNTTNDKIKTNNKEGYSDTDNNINTILSMKEDQTLTSNTPVTQVNKNSFNSNKPASSKSQVKTQYKFISKLIELLETPDIKDVISWNKDGTIIEIRNQRKFVDIVLPQHFKHNNFSNFVRQLNMYHFKKVKNYSVPNVIAYSNQYFKKGCKNLLSEINRRNQNTYHSTKEGSILENENTIKDDMLTNKLNFLFNRMFELEGKVKTLTNVNENLLSNNITFMEDIKDKNYYINMLESLIFYIINHVLPNNIVVGQSTYDAVFGKPGNNTALDDKTQYCQCNDDEKNDKENEDYCLSNSPNSSQVNLFNFCRQNSFSNLGSFNLGNNEFFINNNNFNINTPEVRASDNNVNNLNEVERLNIKELNNNTTTKISKNESNSINLKENLEGKFTPVIDKKHTYSTQIGDLVVKLNEEKEKLQQPGQPGQYKHISEGIATNDNENSNIKEDQSGVFTSFNKKESRKNINTAICPKCLLPKRPLTTPSFTLKGNSFVFPNKLISNNNNSFNNNNSKSLEILVPATKESSNNNTNKKLNNNTNNNPNNNNNNTNTNKHLPNTFNYEHFFNLLKSSYMNHTMMEIKNKTNINNNIPNMNFMNNMNNIYNNKNGFTQYNKNILPLPATSPNNNNFTKSSNNNINQNNNVNNFKRVNSKHSVKFYDDPYFKVSHEEDNNDNSTNNNKKIVTQLIIENNLTSNNSNIKNNNSTNNNTNNSNANNNNASNKFKVDRKNSNASVNFGSSLENTSTSNYYYSNNEESYHFDNSNINNCCNVSNNKGNSKNNSKSNINK